MAYARVPTRWLRELVARSRTAPRRLVDRLSRVLHARRGRDRWPAVDTAFWPAGLGSVVAGLSDAVGLECESICCRHAGAAAQDRARIVPASAPAIRQCWPLARCRLRRRQSTASDANVRLAGSAVSIRTRKQSQPRRLPRSTSAQAICFQCAGRTPISTRSPWSMSSNIWSNRSAISPSARGF